MVARDPKHAKPDTKLALTAARQHGLVTRKQAIAAGLTPEMIKRRLQDGTFSRVYRGIYRLASAPRSWRQTVLAVVLLGGDAAVASHGTAAKLWGYPVSPSHIEITVPARRDAPRGNIKVHRGTVNATESIDGIPVTTPARTLLDIASRVEPNDLESMVDDAITRGLTTRSFLEWELQLTGGAGRYGSKALRAALVHLDHGHCESHLENKILRILLAAGLPTPVRQYEIKAGDFLARVDFAYPHVKLAIEVDGFKYHRDRDPFHNDRRRDTRLASLGWHVIRVTDRDAKDPSDFIEAVRRRLGAALF